MYIAGTEKEMAYMRGLTSIYQPESLVDATSAAVSPIESDVIDCIEVDCDSLAAVSHTKGGSSQ